MPDAELPDIDYLRQRLRYEPDTGKLYWRDCASMPARWLSRWAGTEAFTAGDNNGYRQGCVDNKLYRAHRVIWALHYGAWPSGHIDHIDHDTSNNRISNLRIVSRAENNRNASMRRDNKSGVTGVYEEPRGTKRWRAYARFNNELKCLGLFFTKEEAVDARKNAEKQFGFHENHGRPKLPGHEVSG